MEQIPSADADRILRKVLRLEPGLHGDIKRLQNADYNYRGERRVPLFFADGHAEFFKFPVSKKPTGSPRRTHPPPT